METYHPTMKIIAPPGPVRDGLRALGFKAQDGDYEARMSAALRMYAEAHKAAMQAST